MPIELPLRQSETILLAIGTNDAQVLGDTMHPRVTDQEFTDNLSTTISLAKQYARWVIPLGLFGLFPPQNGRSSNRWIPPERHHTIDQLITQVAAAHQCWHIPFGNLLPPEEFFPDGVHPNAAGHDRIARHVWEALRPTGCLGLPETVPAWGAGTSNDSAQ
jgi:lysophospholipase L1-like esterase